MTPLYFGLCVRKGRRRGLLSVAVVQQTVIVFVGSWTARLPDQVVFLNPTRPHRVGPPCSFTDGPPLGWVPRLGRFHACVLIETVCELLHAITESRASGGSLSLELFCRSNFIHQTQVYFPPLGTLLGLFTLQH